MADTMVEALSGAEIIEDVLNQIKLKLLTSCDLRDSDSYGGGYSAEVTIKLKTYAMDVREEDFAVVVSAKVAPPVSTEEVTVIPVEINETIKVEQEEDLEVVRSRMTEEAPAPVVDEAEEAKMPVRLRRKYARRTSLEIPSMPLGGAVDLSEE